jgi:hypothetical protein
MTLRDNCLPIFENARVLLDNLGFRRYDVLLRVIDWSGATTGKGTKTTLDTPLVIQQTHRIKVRRLTSQDILASGGKYSDGDYRVGPITPIYIDVNGQTGGQLVDYFDPDKSLTSKREFYFRLTGPGMDLGKWFKKIDQQVDTNFSYYFTLRAAPTSDP